MLCLEFHLIAARLRITGATTITGRAILKRDERRTVHHQDAFFTNTTAQATFQKRLRLPGWRYGYSPNLLAWQFWSEIDNE